MNFLRRATPEIAAPPAQLAPRNDLISVQRPPDGPPILRGSVGQRLSVPDPEQPPQPPWIGGWPTDTQTTFPTRQPPRALSSPAGLSCRRSRLPSSAVHPNL